MTEEDFELTPEERQQLQTYLGAANQDPKYNVHTFLNMVAKSPDTTKLGNLREEELGTMLHTLRANKVAALISKDIMCNPELDEYFTKKGEILTATSLSKQGFLDRLAVVQKKEIADLTPERKENKGWFKKKESDPNNMNPS